MAYRHKLDKDIRCPLEYGLEVFGGKWKFQIICVLAAKEVLRYSELRICQWAGLYHKEDYSNTMVHCQKCDYNPR